MIPIEPDQTQAVYISESMLLPSTKGRHFSSMTDVEIWLQSVIDSAWFRKRFPESGEIKLLDGRGNKHAYCQQRDDAWHIPLPREYRYQLAVLHELAHVVAPGNHGREFCSAYLLLVRRFLGAEAARDLRMEFVGGKVKHRRWREPEPWPCDELGTPLF
jgi:putative metallohydrolase (TIGR04338 family)